MKLMNFQPLKLLTLNYEIATDCTNMWLIPSSSENTAFLPASIPYKCGHINDDMRNLLPHPICKIFPMSSDTLEVPHRHTAAILGNNGT